MAKNHLLGNSRIDCSLCTENYTLFTWSFGTSDKKLCRSQTAAQNQTSSNSHATIWMLCLNIYIVLHIKLQLIIFLLMVQHPETFWQNGTWPPSKRSWEQYTLTKQNVCTLLAVQQWFTSKYLNILMLHWYHHHWYASHFHFSRKYQLK